MMDTFSDGLLQILDICAVKQVQLWEEKTVKKLMFCYFYFFCDSICFVNSWFGVKARWLSWHSEDGLFSTSTLHNFVSSLTNQRVNLTFQSNSVMAQQTASLCVSAVGLSKDNLGKENILWGLGGSRYTTIPPSPNHPPPRRSSLVELTQDLVKGIGVPNSALTVKILDALHKV